MTRSATACRVAALASLLVLPLCWFVALHAQPFPAPLIYPAYLLVVIAAPGTLFWRRLTGGTGWFEVDAVLGTVFGLALECLVYPLGRWLDVPLLPLILPALAVGVFFALPGKPTTRRSMPWSAAAGVMVSVAVVAVWYERIGSRVIALTGPLALRPNTDSPYQLALSAELTHHFPPQVPYVVGEPLTYHWMVFGHIASAHWITGIELDVLTNRIEPFVFLLLTTLGAASVAVVLSGRALAAPIGAGLTVLAGDLSPWPWTTTNTLYHDNPLSMGQMISQTQAFAAVLMLPLIAVTALLLRRTPERSRKQVAGLLGVAAVLIATLSVAKATAIPVYGAGLAVAWLHQTVRARRLDLRATALGIMVAICYALNFLVVLHGASNGMALQPGQTFRAMLGGMVAGIDPAVHPGTSVLVIVSAGLLIGWLMPGVGVLLIQRRIPGDPMAVMLLAGLVSAIGAAALLWQYSQAQVFFARSGFVYGVLIATWGLSCLSRRQLFAAVPALALGAAAIYVGRARTPGLPKACGDNSCLDKVFAEPILITFALAAAGVLVLGLLLRASRRTWAALAVAAAIGMTVAPTLVVLRQVSGPSQSLHDSIAPGGIEAARFIRRQSGPDDVIATNIHCHDPAAKRCHHSSFWIAAYAERRVLVQGWCYTAEANATGNIADAMYGPFWDQEKLRINDEAFTAPTRAGLESLRTRYGVDWLLADERVGQVPDELGRLAELRFQSGTVRVYQLYPPPSQQPAEVP
jgi:hypothetical protein